MHISKEGLDLIKKYEGCILKAYLCPANVWTIGYGRTGPNVKAGMVITKAQANQFLKEDVVRYENSVKAALGTAAKNLLQEEFDAMTSLCYNIGPANFKKSSVARLYIAGNKTASANAFGMWNKAKVKGKLTVLNGLTKRRAEEKTLFLSATGSKTASRIMADGETTDVPEGSIVPASANDRPLTRSKEVAIGGALSVGGLGSVFDMIDSLGVEDLTDIKTTATTVAQEHNHGIAADLHVPEIAGAMALIVGIFIMCKRIADRKKGIR